ncbi:MAG: pirin family protein [Verrucomicrobiota bacterium]
MIEHLLEAQPRDLGGFSVGRVLPSIARRMVGPFVFFDHFGPADFAPGTGMDVRPHPHINLATVTYLFDGEILHRDNIGSREVIRPGGINWMTAGSGIAHSERTPPDVRQRGSRAHGLQLWVALPAKHEETAPSFRHHGVESLPLLEDAGVRARVLAGTAYGATSPVETLSSLFYVDVSLPAGGALPLPRDHVERAAYVVEGAVSCGSQRVAARNMMVFAPGTAPTLRAEAPARLVLVGGEPLDGPRHVWWNFVSSRKERIEQAKQDWQRGLFAPIPGDDKEFIPLPDKR